jgi:hypothetical protein
MEPHGYWTRPICICDIDLQKIHPHIISVNTTSYTTKNKKQNTFLFPSEFREGPAVSIRYINSNFFTEFTDYLWIKGLENILGLKAI